MSHMYIDSFRGYILVALLCNILVVCQEFEWGGRWDVGLVLAYLPIFGEIFHFVWFDGNHRVVCGVGKVMFI